MEKLEQPENLGSNAFGKFKDAESLMRAYSNLESEFTKKSQKLAQLESEKENEQKIISRKAEIERKVDEFVTKFEKIKPFSSALKESLINNENSSLEDEAISILSNNYKSAEEFMTDDEFLNKYIYSNKDIKDKIVKEYLSNITLNSPIKMNSSASNISLTPPSDPTTIKEAGKLAKSIIKQK